MSDERKPVTARFYRLIPGIPAPRRADRSADGMMTMRAYRYCESMTAASAFGWYFYPPTNFSLLLDDDEIFWTYEGADGSYPLGGAQFPGFRPFFESHAPDKVKRYAPPFLAASRDPGVVQIWSGYLAWTAPGWGLLSRRPANIPITKGYDCFDGLMETNFWFGPLIANIRLTRSGRPVDFHMTQPLFQAQPVMHECYQEPGFEVLEFGDLGHADWERFHAAMEPNANSMRRPGHYAVQVRKERHAEATHTEDSFAEAAE